MTTDIVERIKVEKWTNRDGEDVTSYKVSLVNEAGQREVPCYSPLGKDLKEDAPLPEGWEVKTSKAGKPYLAAPRQSSGGGGGGLGRSGISTAWRNTEAGAKYEDERVDRRRALEQAVAAHAVNEHEVLLWADVLITANNFYRWLRESVSAPTPSNSVHRDATSGGADTISDEGGGTSYGTPEASRGRTGEPPSAPQASPPPSSSTPDRDKTRTFPHDCHCGQPYGARSRATGKRLCMAGHVEKFDYA